MIAVVLLFACNGDKDDPTGDTGATDLSPWEIAADEVTGGVMLSAWTDPGSNEVLVVGGGLVGGTGTLWRYDGSTLCYEEDVAEQPLWWIHGRGAGDWVAVGASGVVVEESAGVRTRDDIPTTATLFGVYDDGAELWAVAGNIEDNTGEAWRRPDGGVWEKVADLPNLMFKVWDEWFVGAAQSYRWDGAQLVETVPPDFNRLMTVRGASSEDVWAVGDGVTNSEVHHYASGTWTQIEPDVRCVGQGLNGVWTDEGEDVWITGFFGLMARYDGTAWDCPNAPLTAEHFHATWRWNDETLFFGGNMFASSGHYGTLGRYNGDSPVTVEACSARR